MYEDSLTSMESPQPFCQRYSCLDVKEPEMSADLDLMLCSNNAIYVKMEVEVFLKD